MSERRGLAAGAVAAVVVGFAAATGTVAAASGLGWWGLVDSNALTTLVFGVAFGLCGALLGWQRPRNPVGWLFAAGGVGYALSGLGNVLSFAGVVGGWSTTVVALVTSAQVLGWPLAIGVAFPLAVLVFPNGQLPTSRWRAAVALVCVTGTLFAVSMVGAPGNADFDGHQVPHWLTIPGYDRLAPLWTIAIVGNAVSVLVVLASLVGRYRRGEEVVKRQLLWPLLAIVLLVVGAASEILLGFGPALTLLGIVGLPVAVVIAVLRHQLLDIRLVVTRTLAWLLVSAAVLGAFTLIVALLEPSLSRRGAVAVAALAVALAFAPARDRVQRAVNRLFYGQRDDPVGAVLHLSEHIGGEDLAPLGAAVQHALRVPHVAVRRMDGAEVVAVGTPSGAEHTIDLRAGTEVIGKLAIGVRRGQAALAPADIRLAELLAMPVALALQATDLARELQRARKRLVAAREEERRRMRRDLHDGLGPGLTGATMLLDAAANEVDRDSAATRQLLGTARGAVGEALAEVRRIVDGLRPASLDDHGLLPVLRAHADALCATPNGPDVSVDAGPLPATLPAAIEVATVRIVLEALTNVVRHSTADRAWVRLEVVESAASDVDRGMLRLEIRDDGVAPAAVPWIPGVGLASMRERAEELGGSLDARPEDTGGRVVALLPLETG